MSEIEPSIDTIATQLVRLHRLRDRALAQVKDRSGIDPAGFVVLFRLVCDGPMRSGALAEAVHSDASTVSRQVAQLVDRGLVVRTADPVDGRATVLEVTESGREVAARIRVRRQESVAIVTEQWSAEDRASFAALLTRFVTDYDRARPLLNSVQPALSTTATEDHS
ncbi:MarR family winged helix-turn-helix transcriptional regulator [Nocardia mangyaensis]|uniref:MarR family winged helix-turn-helix transcriptional regulator n=1 Tax=Nocardia mangyaensis TaxID=2213200 RepID=UPI002676F510|nr:MarR family transcriptional regulator [Nocardia mangyaensis]MDO3650976.1 MarR family transcriptional regulator [Nocardia mangyaensis]